MFDPSVAQTNLITGGITSAIALVGLYFVRRDARKKNEETEINITSKMVEAMEVVNRDLRVEIDRIKSKIEALELERDRLITKITQLEARIAEVTNERDRLRIELTQVDTEIIKLRAQLDILSNAKPVIVEVKPIVHAPPPANS